MTQPAAPPPSHADTVVAVAVIGLALIAVEARVRSEVDDDITAALVAYTALLLAALAAPGVAVTTGVQLMSRDDVHTGLVRTIGTLKTTVAANIEAGYQAAAHVALMKATADLKHDGYTVPAALPELGTTIDRILDDVDTMLGHAQTDVQNSVIAAFDGVQGPDADAARRLVIARAVDKATARLMQRAQAAAGTAVNQGSSDAQQAIYSRYRNDTGRPGLAKRWVVTAVDPCGMCEALNGAVVALDAEFDHDATTVDKDLRPVWRNLLGPPRHPNCRCQLELVTTSTA